MREGTVHRVRLPLLRRKPTKITLTPIDLSFPGDCDERACLDRPVRDGVYRDDERAGLTGGFVGRVIIYAWLSVCSK